jgi:hypothetical protein
LVGQRHKGGRDGAGAAPAMGQGLVAAQSQLNPRHATELTKLSDLCRESGLPQKPPERPRRNDGWGVREQRRAGQANPQEISKKVLATTERHRPVSTPAVSGSLWDRCLVRPVTSARGGEDRSRPNARAAPAVGERYSRPCAVRWSKRRRLRPKCLGLGFPPCPSSRGARDGQPVQINAASSIATG